MLLYGGAAQSQAEPATISLRTAEAGEYQAGFRVIDTQDYARTVTGGTSGAVAYPRPVRVYLWYPAVRSEGAHNLRFGRYAELADDDIWPAEIVGGLRESLSFSRRPLARSLGKEAFNALLDQPLTAVEGATPSEGRFPLIVLGQGVYYESPVVFAALGEYLASNGFVVATCPLVGTNSPIVTVDEKGLETQVRDLEFVIALSRRLSFVSQDKLGVFGFDMGGMAGLILSMRNADVDAFASVSSGILYPHPAGIPADSVDYDPTALRAPWLHSIPTSWIRQSDSPGGSSLFDAALYSERYLLLTEGMGHVDYTGYALIEGRPSMVEYWDVAKPGDVDRYKAVYRYIANFYSAYLEGDTESLAFLSQNRSTTIRGTTMTLDYRAAVSPPITYEAFVKTVIEGRTEQAVDAVRDLAETHPHHTLLDEEHLNRIIYSLRGTWRLDDRLLPLLEFIVELYPESTNALSMLGDGYSRLGNYTRAIETYYRLLELAPKDRHKDIESRLEWLKAQHPER